jgi:hypothetical protein
MKGLALIAIMFSMNAYATGPFASIGDFDFCKGQVVDKDGYSAVCTGAKNANEVVKAKVGKSVVRLPAKIELKDGIFDFGILPDADTNAIYGYNKELINEKGVVIGYLSIDGYVNTEMEARMQLKHRYNLQGELVFFEAYDF